MYLFLSIRKVIQEKSGTEKLTLVCDSVWIDNSHMQVRDLGRAGNYIANRLFTRKLLNWTPKPNVHIYFTLSIFALFHHTNSFYQSLYNQRVRHYSFFFLKEMNLLASHFYQNLLWSALCAHAFISSKLVTATLFFTCSSLLQFAESQSEEVDLYHPSITPILKNLHWRAVKQRMNFKILLPQSVQPIWTTSYFITRLIWCLLLLRSSSSNLLSTPQRLNRLFMHGDRSFSVIAPLKHLPIVSSVDYY